MGASGSTAAAAGGRGHESGGRPSTLPASQPSCRSSNETPTAWRMKAPYLPAREGRAVNLPTRAVGQAATRTGAWGCELDSRPEYPGRRPR